MLIKALGTYDKKDNSYLENFLLETLNANLFLVLKKKNVGKYISLISDDKNYLC